MTYFLATKVKLDSARTRSARTLFDWKHASKASICAFMLAFAPLSVAIAQAAGDDDYIAPPAPAAAADDDIAAPAPAAPAEPAAAAAAVAAPAAAVSASASTPSVTTLGDVAVTGTAIARTDAATALPVTIVSKEQLEKQGITSTAQILQQLPQNNSDAGEGLGSGLNITGGANFADLRGLGPRHTLVLLNGRRLSNDAFDGGSVDVNTIPFAAIDRVEILRDGASALYGTDAVAGVINFITKKNEQGGNLTLQYTQPTQSGGGVQRSLEATFGKGDLDKDRYNFMISGSYRRQDPVSVNDRDFFVLQDPSRGVDSTSSFPAPASYFQGNSPLLNPAAPACDGPLLVAGGSACRFNPSAYSNVIGKSDRASVFTRGAFKINDNNQVSLSYLYANNQSSNIGGPGLSTGPLPTLQPGTPFFPGNGITPAPTNYDLDPNQPISLYYRNIGSGARITNNQNEAHRVVLNFTGKFEKVHYDTAFSYNQDTTDISYGGGYYDFDQLQNLLNTTVNPFVGVGQLSQSQRDSLQGITRSGTIDATKAREYTWDGKLSRELGDWFGGGQVAMAVGGQYRHQQLIDSINNELANEVGNSGGGISPSDKVDEDRDIESIFSELNIPLFENLELNGSFRYDNYSDVGDTVNPKVSLRYQPIKQVVLRGSYSEGFSAPTLYQLYSPQSTTFTAPLDDPRFNCVDGAPTAPGAPSQGVCNFQFNRLLGGNPDLQPETSRNWTYGLVVSPIDQLSFGVDLWYIELTQQIGALAPSTILDNPNSLGNLVQRDGNGQITQITTTNGNFGKTETSGVDFSANYALSTDLGVFGFGFNGTLTHKFSYQTRPDSDYEQAAGVYSGFVAPKWKHQMTVSWAKEQWNAQLTNQFSSGYRDADDSTNLNVHDYMTFDGSVGYRFLSGVQLTLGSQNIFDRDPPFSNQTDAGFGGFDSRYADPLGRTVFGQLAYDF